MKLLEHIKSEWPVLKEAPFAFTMLLVLGIGLGFAGGLAWNAREIAALEREMKSLPLAEAIRNPDGVYQLGKEVATVKGADISAGTGTVTFREIGAEGEFNPNRPFEYRDYVLLIKKVGRGSRMGFGNRVADTFVDIECEIVETR